MAGLDPAIHLLERALRKRWDARASPRRRGFGPAGGSSPRLTKSHLVTAPGSAAHRFAKSYALRCVRGMVLLPHQYQRIDAVGHAAPLRVVVGLEAPGLAA